MKKIEIFKHHEKAWKSQISMTRYLEDLEDTLNLLQSALKQVLLFMNSNKEKLKCDK